MPSIHRRTALLGALAAPLAARRAAAADYPTRPIRLIVPYAPGGGADAVARIIAKLAGDSMGQSIVVENKGGAGSIVGTDLVAKSAPDGYTLLLGQSGPISINPAVYKSLPYDPVKELTPVSMTNSYPYVLVINSKTP
ncbi:MAG: tripartite tricarboxylate transporter substrate binding protein, partial [Alphaproteobacteria bacterium]